MSILCNVARANRQEKEIKDVQIGKEEIKWPLFVDDMILYVEHTKKYIKKLLEP